MSLWNTTDVLRAGEPSHGVALDWVTSKGMLTRAAAFDAVHGPDPRLFPLNHVDKDYGTHLRAHGWTLYLAPEAQLFHEGSRSAPRSLRLFLLGWQEPRFNARWGEVVRGLGPGEAREVAHACATWEAGDPPAIERLVGREASLLVVAFSAFAAVRADGLQGEIDAVRAEHDRVVGDYRGSSSWRLTAPLRAVGRLIRRPRRD